MGDKVVKVARNPPEVRELAEGTIEVVFANEPYDCVVIHKGKAYVVDKFDGSWVVYVYGRLFETVEAKAPDMVTLSHRRSHSVVARSYARSRNRQRVFAEFGSRKKASPTGFATFAYPL